MSVICAGEILIDFFGSGKETGLCYDGKVGGAPLNVAAGLHKFGKRPVFVGAAGSDVFGDYICAALKKLGLESDIERTPQNTTLAFVTNEPNGERSFSFYKSDTADLKIPEKKVAELIKSGKYRILHLGSLMLRDKAGQEKFRSMLSAAKSGKLLTSFDFNYRADLYDDPYIPVKLLFDYVKDVDILKLSYDEAMLIDEYIAKKCADGAADGTAYKEKVLKEQKENGFSTALVENVLDKLKDSGASAVFVTLGAHGSLASVGKQPSVCVKGFPVKPIDTTGAGDAYFAAVLTSICETGGLVTDVDALADILRFANAAGALTTTGYGAIDALPDLKDIKNLQITDNIQEGKR